MAVHAIWHPLSVSAHSSRSLVGCGTSKDMWHDGTQQLAYSLVCLCGLQAAHQCLLSAKASLESLQIITLNFQRWKKRNMSYHSLYLLLQSAEGRRHNMRTDETRRKQDSVNNSLSTQEKYHSYIIFSFVMSHLMPRNLQLWDDKFSFSITFMTERQGKTAVTVRPLCNSMWHLYKCMTVQFWQDHCKVTVRLRSQKGLNNLVWQVGLFENPN